MGIHKLPAVSYAAVILLFLALCAYAGAGIYSELYRDYRLETVQPVSIKDSLSLKGIAVRREQPVCSPAFPQGLPKDGSRLPAGTLIGVNSRSEELFSSDSALFFRDTDGFEFLKPEDFYNLSPSGLKDILNLSAGEEGSSCGRLVFFWDWYYAAICSSDPALTANAPCTLSFSGCKDPAKGRIVSLSAPERGEVFVLIRLNTGGENFMRLRKTEAQLILADYSGLKVPEKALCRDAEGNEFVYTLTAGKPEKKAVEIIYKASGTAVAAQSDSPSALQAGNRLIIPEKNLRRGKVFK